MNSIWITAFVVNGFLVSYAQRFPLLTKEGWVHAGVLGTLLWGCLGWNGWFAVVIYLALGSFVTKLGFAKKQLAGIAEGRGGRRGPENIWGSAGTGAILALLIKAGFWSRSFLMIGFAASFSAKLADTFGSEVGKRWGRKTFLITNFRSVPPGTDGAVSLEGTLASALGSCLMTFTMVLLGLVPPGPVAYMVFFVGLVSTLLESLFGALLQHRISWLTNELVNSIQTTFSAFTAILLSLYLI